MAALNHFAFAIKLPSLDSMGRWFLGITDYRHYGLFIAAVLICFTIWRRRRYGSWPGHEDYVAVVTSIVAILGATTTGIVFLLTKPPAVELLPSQSLLLIGLFLPIVVYSYALPRLRGLFLPPEVEEKPPKDEPSADENGPKEA